MKLLVTGGAGFIGSNFIHYWFGAHPDDTIVCLDAFTYAGNIASLLAVMRQPNFALVKGDITDREAVAYAMKGVDAVVHFAAESHVDRSVLDPSAFVRTNVLGTQVLLDEAVRQKITRFHHVSTDEVFGSLELDDSRPAFNEESLLRPNSPYAASKAGSDLLVRAYGKTYSLPITITNTSNNYGAYQFPEKLIPLMIIKALHGQSLPVYGDGLNVRDWIHVEDHCRAIDLVLHKGTVGETYCVGGDNERSNIDVVRTILQTLGKDLSLIEYIKDRPGHDRRYAVDSTKIKRELGFEHYYSFESGLAETIKWYQEHEAWWRPLLDKEFEGYYARQYIERIT